MVHILFLVLFNRDTKPSSFNKGNAISQGVHLQVSRAHRNDSYIQYRGTLPELIKFTVCMKLFRYHATPYESIISYAIEDSDNELLIGQSLFMIFLQVFHN